MNSYLTFIILLLVLAGLALLVSYHWQYKKRCRHAAGNASFAADVQPLFRQKDIDSMKEERGIDLSDYATAKELAPQILARLKEGSMPCDGAWPPEKVAILEKWMNTGYAV